MRLTLLAALAALLLVPTAGITDDEKKPMLPDLKAKEWKKLGDAGLEIWDVKEGRATRSRPGPS